jgi:two-component system LytT family response regulator
VKILIVEDELLAFQRLERMLRTLGHENITHALDGNEALEHVSKNSFDVAFLDINMPNMNGLELGYELRYRQSNFSIIFQTAYQEHALEAFDIGAVGYLVKPYSIEQLKTTFERLQSEVIVKDLRLLTKSGDHHYLLKPDEIYYVKADLAEVQFRSDKGFSYYSQKISILEPLLATYNFVRVHRSYLVNIDKISEMETIEQSKLRFYFKGISDVVESSKEGAKGFRHQFT